MKKSAFVALGAMLVAGSALASNTGFKLNYPLGYNATGSNQNWVSFPLFYFPNGNVSVTQQNSVNVCADLNDFQTGTPKVTQLVKWVTATSQPLVQFCATTSKAAYNITPGEAYSAVPPGPGIVVNIVGSNNDAFAPNKGGTTTYPLTYAVPGSNQNWVSVPYHVVADNSVELCGMFQAQTGSKISQVVKWVTVQSQPLVQFCATVSKAAYNVTPGEAYSVVPTAAGLAIGFNVY